MLINPIAVSAIYIMRVPRESVDKSNLIRTGF